jgi:LysM repeat protein
VKYRPFLLSIIYLLPLIWLFGCYSDNSEDIQVENSAMPTVISFQTVTPNLPTPTQIIEETQAATPLPSPTPFIYTIVENDTLNGLAFKYGVTLNELLAVNPTLNPQFLSIGAIIRIPISSEVGDQLSNSNVGVEQVSLGDPFCIETKSESMWCYLWVENPLEINVDNLEIKFSLLDLNETIIHEGKAYLPINQLKAGEKLPAVIYFPSVVEAVAEIKADIVSALSVGSDARYFSPTIEETNTDISASGMLATWSGNIIFSNQDLINQVFVAMIAFDSENNFSGVNKYQFAASELISEETRSFAVYSISGNISSVKIYVEGRP